MESRGDYKDDQMSAAMDTAYYVIIVTLRVKASGIAVLQVAPCR